jgi:type IV pilus assembly protein PilW
MNNIRNRYPHINRRKGFTLVEIMVALAISSILMLGIIQVFSNSKRSSKVNEAVSRVQENARFAMEYIITDFRKAGYVGCNADNMRNFVDTSGTGGESDLFNLSTGTGGWEYTASSTKPDTTEGTPYVIPSPFTVTTEAAASWDNTAGDNIPTDLVGKVAPGSDVIILKWAEPKQGVTGSPSNKVTTNAQVGTTAAHGIPQGGLVILSNCISSDAFMNVSNSTTTLARGTAVGYEPGNIIPSTNEWTQPWDGDTQIMGVESRAYYIGQGAGGGPALFRMNYSNGLSNPITTEELVEGIENIQILYGVDTDDNGIIDSYDTAENVSHAQVVSLQLGMIVASDAESLSTAKARTLNVIGTYIKTPNDRKLRYVFSSTTKLRNKGVK